MDRLQTVSGPVEGNAGTEEKTESVKGIDAAIDKALGSAFDQPAPAPEKQEESSKSADDTTQTGERAAAPEAKAEKETPAPAAPTKEGNAGTVAPKHWPDERKQVFESLPTPEAKQAMLKLARDLEAGFTRKSQQLADQAKYAETIGGLFTDAERAELRSINANEAAAVDYLLKLNRWAGQDPKAYIKWAMQNFRVTPEDLSGAQPQPAAKPEGPQKAGQSSELDDLLADPRLKALESEFKPVKDLVQTLARQWEAREQQAAQAEQSRRQSRVASIMDGINRFRSEIDDAGQLRYPHFDRLRADMGALMNTRLASMPDGPEKMAKAYEMALRADPDLSQEWVKHETAKAIEADRKSRDAQKARAATGIRPAIGVAQQAQRSKGLDNAIDQALNRFGV